MTGQTACLSSCRRPRSSRSGDTPAARAGQCGPRHLVVGLADGTTRGGHLLEGRVFPALEMVVTETPAELRRVMRSDPGVALIDLARSEA